MNLTWSVLALVLLGAQDPQPSQPNPPSSSSSAVEIKSRDPQSFGSPASPKASNASVAKTITAGTLKMQLPKVARPRTNGNPEEAPESWPMRLDVAIRIALDNSEVVRVIAFGAQGLPIEGFEPTPMNLGAPAGVACSLGSGIAPLEGQSVGQEANRTPIVIARLNADASLWRFKAEVMAQVRSVEQTYWHLAQAHTQLWAADSAVSLAKEFRDREQAELEEGRGTTADVAEATKRLEQLNLDLVNRTSYVATTERQLRFLLGLPPADNRRIIPVTPPSEGRVEFDWDTCLNEMMDEQPDIVQQKLLVRVAELQLLIARNQLLPPQSLTALDELKGLGQSFVPALGVMNGAVLRALDQVAADERKASDLNENPGEYRDFSRWQSGFCFQMSGGVGRTPLANTRQAQYFLLRSQAYLKQVVHQTTHSLARFFLEVDADYKQYKTASRLREAAARRLDAQRAYYEGGRITIDRLLDAVSQYATAVATEAQYKTTYNIALVAVAEAKGTLLADRGIVVAEGPRPRKAYLPAHPTQEVATPSEFIRGTPQWVEVEPVVRRTRHHDRQTVLASFHPETTPDVEVPRDVFIARRDRANFNCRDPLSKTPNMPRIISINDLPTAPKVFATSTTAVDLWPSSPCRDREADTPSTSAASDPSCATAVCSTPSDIAKAKQPAKAKTWTFSLSIGTANPLQIKGTITQTETDDPSPAKP